MKATLNRMVRDPRPAKSTCRTSRSQFGGRGRGAADSRIRSGTDLSWAWQKERNQLSQTRFTGLALAAIALTGCSYQAATMTRDQPRCELVAADICSMAMQSQKLVPVNTTDTLKPDEARVEPLIVPLLLPNGRPAAVVDCYVNTDMRSFELVYTVLSIPPRSKDAIDYLRGQHLCADEESYAEGKHNRFETASAFLSSRSRRP